MMPFRGPQVRPLPHVEVPKKPDPSPPTVPGVRAGRARVVDAPQPGFFLIRLVRKGPWVTARIHHEWGHWWAEVDGKPVGAKTEDVLTADRVLSIWHHGREIDEREYRRWLRIPAADRPDPHKPVDLRRKESLF